MSWRPFKIHEVVEVSDLDKLINLVNRGDFDFFKITHYGNQNIKFESKNSIGIGSINSLVFEPITIKALLFVDESKSSKLVFYNSLRVDTITINIIVIIFIVMLFYQQIVLGEHIPFWINCILLPFVILFFNWLYYKQEKSLLMFIKGTLLSENCITILK